MAIALKESPVYNLVSGLSMITPSSLRTLSIDTSTTRGSVALLEGGEVIAELRLLSPETHSARLLRSIELLLTSVNWRLSDLGLVAAGIGPGSFTGIRIGISTSLGLAQVLSLPFAGVSGLDALAGRSGLPEGRLGVVMDAQRSEIYYGEYRRSPRSTRRIIRPMLCSLEALRKRISPRGLRLVGDGASRYRRNLGASGTGWPRFLEVDLFLAGDIGRLSVARRRLWQRGDFLHAEPLYLRPPDALRSLRRMV